MNGAQALLRTLVASGVDTCFTNPGTSEMHFVAALDDVPEMRAVLTLFEGVATGAADGYARMAGKPAATLLHLGPGLGNGLANLHNARRARTPVVNIVGDHATFHEQYDAPLQSDIEGVARNVSRWIGRCNTPAEVGPMAAEAIVAAQAGGVATLILPADASWLEGAEVGPVAAQLMARRVSVDVIDRAAKALNSGEPTALLLGGRALSAEGLALAGDIAAASGAKLLCETFPARLERGSGVVAVDRLGYLAEFAVAQLDGLQHLVLVDAKAPVSFFAYPEKPSDLVPEGCEVHELVPVGLDAPTALLDLANALGYNDHFPRGAGTMSARPDRPTGPLNMETIANAIGALLPEGAIVSDEGNTSGLFVAGATAGAPRHSWLTLTGGAIGQGMPVATGAAVACPDRKVINLEADGSAMYTLQSLWTQAREGLDVTTIIFNNRSYAILNLELSRVGARTDGNAAALFDLSQPPLDFVALAQGMGVPATRAETADDFVTALERAIAEPGPSLIDAIL
jgi:acetolactate synthase-1/2/3 large subunit